MSELLSITRTQVLYRQIIDQVIKSAEADFFQEGHESQLLSTLQNEWERRLVGSGAVNPSTGDDDGETGRGMARESAQFDTVADKEDHEVIGSSSGAQHGGPGALHASSSQSLRIPGREADLEEGEVPADNQPQAKRPRLRSDSRSQPSAGFGAVESGGELEEGVIGDGHGDGDKDKGGKEKDGDREGVEVSGSGNSDDKDGNGGNEEEEDEGSLLGSDDDLPEDDDGDVANLILCQFEKVHRARNRWKCHLVDGVMHMNGRDHLFTRAFSDTEFK